MLRSGSRRQSVLGGADGQLVPDDLTKLRNLDPESIEEALKIRFNKDEIYSNINALLVAMNPYKKIDGIYSQQRLEEYTQYASMPEKPHVYAVAADAYRGLLESRSQSLIISGESGAGARRAAAHGALRAAVSSSALARRASR